MKKTYGRCLRIVQVCGASFLWSTSSYAQTPPNAPTSTVSALPEPPPPPPPTMPQVPSPAPQATALPTHAFPVAPPLNPSNPPANPQVTEAGLPVMPWGAPRASMWGPLVDGRIREEPYWYGKDLGLILAPVDVGTMLLLISGQNDVQIFAFANFAAAHVFMGPIFHWAYGYTGRGFGALTMNVMLPILGGLTGIGTGSEEGLILLSSIGFLSAQAIDIFVLAQGTQRTVVNTPPRPTWRPTSVGIMPWIDQQRTGLSVMGQF